MPYRNLEYLHTILYNTVEIFGGDKWIKFPEDTLIILFHQSV